MPGMQEWQDSPGCFSNCISGPVAVFDRKGCLAMVDFRSEYRAVDNDKRRNPRTELRCDATVFGVDGILIITDISLGGIFVETNASNTIPIGKIVGINLKLPTEKNVIRIKAKTVNRTGRGIGCQFIFENNNEKRAIYRCFDFVRDTLPAE